MLGRVFSGRMARCVHESPCEKRGQSNRCTINMAQGVFPGTARKEISTEAIRQLATCEALLLIDLQLFTHTHCCTSNSLDIPQAKTAHMGLRVTLRLVEALKFANPLLDASQY